MTRKSCAVGMRNATLRNYLNSLLYTNSKLYKIGYSQLDLCTFCKSYPEKFNDFLYSYPCSKPFWDDFELFWFSGTQKTINLTQQDVIVGVLSCSCPLLNYFLLVAKIIYGILEETRLIQISTVFKLKF